MTNEPFDYRKAAEELSLNQSETGGAKLSTHQQCEALAALLNKAKPPIVARAFGLSRIAVSQLKNCQTNKRYRAACRELTALGEDHFLHKYYTQDLHSRLGAARLAILQDRQARIFGAPNKAAHAKAARNIGAFSPTQTEGDLYGVYWIGHKTDSNLAGWWFSPCDAEAKEPLGGWQWHGLESISHSERKPFRTSTLAWRAAYTFCNIEPPK